MEEPRISLTKVERLMLANQLKILERLYPTEAESYAHHREALEDGYALHYDWLFEHISDEFPVEKCRFVLDVLGMYRAIHNTFPNGLPKELAKDAKFPGFDGNDESEYLAYARYFVGTLNRFPELRGETDFDLIANSHMSMVGRYRRMLELWQSFGDKHQLSASQAKSLLAVR